MTNLTRTADHLADVLENMGFVIMSEKSGRGLPVVAFRLPDKKNKMTGKGESERHYDEFALAHQLRSRGWIVPAYTMAPHTEELKMLRVVVREDFSRSRCEQLILDIKLCIGLLEEMDEKQLKELTEFVKKRDGMVTERGRGHGKGGHKMPEEGNKYKDQSHNLHGKTNKTHPVC